MRRNKIIVCVIILFTISFLSIGFSAFNASVFVEDIGATVRLNTDIRVTSVSPYSFTSNAISNSEDYDVSSVKGEVYLPNDDSTITYKVDITNIESTEMGILNIVMSSEVLDYEIATLSDYNLREKLCVNNKCNLGITKELYIIIKYKNNLNISGNITHSFKLDFEFKPFYKVSYIDITNNNYPTEIMEGSTLSVNFSPQIDTNIKISMSGNLLDSGLYTFTNKNTLSIPNVSGDIIITRLPAFTEILIANNNVSSNCPEVDGNYAIITTTETTKALFCTLPDIYGTSYYFRGTPINNYVKFAGEYWRIIRINGDNSVRLIYAGSVATDNGYDDSNTLYSRTGLGYFNSTMRTNATVGYMFGSSTTSYANTHTNTNDSLIKSAIDSWYESKNLANYSAYLSDSYFCNDRGVYKSEYSTKFGLAKVTATDNIGGIGTGFADTASGYGTNYTYYAGFYRFVRSDDGTEYPTLMCAKNDSFTKDDTVNGNGALKYPIATITADELVLAGARYHDDTMNNKFYLYTGYRYWAMTPSFMLKYATALNLFSTGWMTGAGTISSNMGYRPVINISADAYVTTGNGKKDTPYELGINT